MDLSIIMVNYRTYHFTRKALESIITKNHLFSFKIYLVDNASGDGSLEKLEADFSKEINQKIIKIIPSSENKGFAYANNLALKEVQSKYVLLLNSDTEIQGNCLAECLHYLETHKEGGALGCRVLLDDGSLDKACRRSFPTPLVSFYRMTGLSLLFPESKRFNQYNLGYMDENGTYEVDSISGAFMMLRSQTIEEVGFLDEEFFMYGEDIDWCYRIKARGWKVVYHGGAQILHHKGA
ncbi:MAG: glycosyltransferase family 2 protein, partial [Methanobacterium sp.]|nr:glycosyltransferase family 2 protein [Methanobacterium sp.]